MTRALFLMMTAACSAPTGATMRDAGLPASPLDVAAAPVERTAPPTQDVDGVTVVPLVGAAPVQIALATDDAEPAVQALLGRQLRSAVAAATGVPTTLTVTSDAIVLTLDSPRADLTAAIHALSTLDLSDLALASAFRTRPDAMGAVTPDQVRSLFDRSATRSHLLLRAVPGTVGEATVALRPGSPLSASHPFRQPDASHTILARMPRNTLPPN